MNKFILTRTENEVQKLWQNNTYLVSICCLVFNHGKYIEKALQGFLLQETNFPFEILIHDDASSDESTSIIREYASNYPNIIYPILQTENQHSKLGGRINFRFNFPRAKGKYIAICEGDDYWIDSKKLQKQVDFLEKNPNYSLCFHSVKVFSENQQKFVIDKITKEVPTTTNLSNLAEGNFIHTPSVVLNKSVINGLPDWLKGVPIGDYPLWCIAALEGKIYKISDEMAVYRIHEKGMMSNYKNKSIDQKIAFNEGMIPFYRYMYSVSQIKHFRKKLIIIINANLSYALTANNIVLAKKYAKILIKNHLLHLSFNQFFSALFTFLFPNQLKKRYAKQG